MEILYHVLNRGVDKRKIFMDDKDCFRFIHDLFEFNDIHNVLHNGYYFKDGQSVDVRRRQIKKRVLLVKLHAFCLMPNHYHLLVSPTDQKNERGKSGLNSANPIHPAEENISLFMKKLNGGYAKYFNERHGRSGALFQGKYKAVPIDSDPHFSWISYYIHFNPLDLAMPEWRERGIKNIKKAEEFLRSYRWSSHLDYLGVKNFPSLTQRDFFLKFFGGEKGYARSVPAMFRGFSIEGSQDLALE